MLFSTVYTCIENRKKKLQVLIDMKNKTLLEQDADRMAQQLRQQTIQKLNRFLELQEDLDRMLRMLPFQQERLQPIQEIRSTERRLQSLRRQINQELDLEDVNESAAVRELVEEIREMEEMLQEEYQKVGLDEVDLRYVLFDDILAP